MKFERVFSVSGKMFVKNFSHSLLTKNLSIKTTKVSISFITAGIRKTKAITNMENMNIIDSVSDTTLRNLNHLDRTFAKRSITSILPRDKTRIANIFIEIIAMLKKSKI